ncbi:MAG: response regulator [Sphingomonadales bacterium]|nr:MAG: response regulator [Sphingomonadales bacterium]
MAETLTGTLSTLIVDDEPLAVDRMRMICDQIPMVRVAGSASDGAEALERIGELSPDLVLLDLTMPEIDGLAAASLVPRRATARAIARSSRSFSTGFRT